VRKAVIAFALVTVLLAVWLKTGPKQDQPVLNPPPADIEPVVVAPEKRSTVATEAAQAIVAADEPAATGAALAEATLPAPSHLFYQQPEFRDGVIASLVASGLAEIDSRRIADEAVSGLRDCAANYGWSSSESRSASPSCDANVLQQAGLDEAVRRAAFVEAGSNFARRRALEALAEQLARQGTR
jgi:hypothetical protein